MWNGYEWSALGSGMDDGVGSLAVDSNGYLYAGGDFATAGGVTANHIARWDGFAWSALGSGTGKRGIMFSKFFPIALNIFTCIWKSPSRPFRICQPRPIDKLEFHWPGRRTHSGHRRAGELCLHWGWPAFDGCRYFQPRQPTPGRRYRTL